MDQSFSIKNLNDLLKGDREKGGDLEERYVPAAFDIRVKLYGLNKLAVAEAECNTVIDLKLEHDAA